MNILFFGSTTDSVTVLESLVTSKVLGEKDRIAAVITQPPRPIGRTNIPVPTPIESWGKSHKIPVLTFDTNPEKPWLFLDDDAVTNTLSTEKPDLLITACYGQKIPAALIALSKHGGLNIHPSLLPRWRGADPVPWTILSGDAQTGATVVTISEKFDQGKIIDQKKIPVDPKVSADDLRSELFRMGAELLVHILPDYLTGSNKGKSQDPTNTTVARKLTRSHGFIPWKILKAAMVGEGTESEIPENFILMNAEGTVAEKIQRALRAFSPWPGVWTTIHVPEEKRLKILEVHVEGEKLIPDTVQMEGKKPVRWDIFTKSYVIA